MPATPSLARRVSARLCLILLALFALAMWCALAANFAHADESAALFFVREHAVARLPSPIRNQARFHPRFVNHGPSGGVRSLIAGQVTARLGAEWVATALDIATIESRGNCQAYNRGAIGVFQVRHPERFGVSPAAARTCAGGVAAGIAHMQHCIAQGARTSRQMMVCHNSGTPFARHVERAYRFALSRH